MATFSLTIDESNVSNDTSLVTNITDTSLLERVFPGAATTAEFTFDRNVSRAVTNRVLTATFGDGYEQRVRNGINPKQEQISIAFANRSSDDITVISAFLDNKTGANFDIIINGETIKVSNEAYNITYSQLDYFTLNTTMKRVYEP